MPVPEPTVNEDELAWLAVEFAQRIRAEDPDDVADWLVANTTERDRWALLFVQAAVGPRTRDLFSQAKRRWIGPELVDEIAVMRACYGEALPLNRLEQAAAIKRLAARGESQSAISRTLGICRRQVQRIVSGQVRWARDVA